jgi:hypothetical protein
MADNDIRGRYRRDFTSEPIKTRQSEPVAPTTEPQLPKPLITDDQRPAKRRVKRKKARRLWLIFPVLCLILAAGAAGWYYKNRPTDPVPKNIKAAVSFPIYYPDQTKLPAGYSLDLFSFSTGQGAVIYKVNYDTHKLIFTVQKKPSDAEISAFYKSNMPLHIDEKTDIGTAAIGVLNNQMVASLPTNSNAWILVTATKDADQNKLKQVLHSLKPPR